MKKLAVLFLVLFIFGKVVRELEERADILMETNNNSGWIIMKSEGSMPDDLVEICRMMGLFKDED